MQAPLKKLGVTLLILFLCASLIILPQIKPAKATTTLALHVDGNQIKDSNNNVFYLRGVNRPQFGESATGIWCAPYGDIYNRTWVNMVLNRMQYYGFTALRCFIDASYWVNNPTLNTESGTLTFRQILDDLLTRMASRGIYLILSSGVINTVPTVMGYPPYTAQTLFTQSSFINYVIQQVTVLGSHNNLIIEPWNEPDYGWYGTDEAKLDLWQADWQDILDGIRATETANGQIHHLFMAGYWSTLAGWSNMEAVNFNYVANYPLTDSSGNTVWTVHCYRGDSFGGSGGSMGTVPPYPTLASLPHSYADVKTKLQYEHLDTFSASHPVFIGEIGCDSNYDAANERDYLTNTLQIFNEWGISYASWWWRNENYGGFNMITAGSESTTGGTVTTVGQILVDAIAAGGPPPPPPDQENPQALRPNAVGTYNQFVEVVNSGFLFGDQFENNNLTLIWGAPTVSGSTMAATAIGAGVRRGSYGCSISGLDNNLDYGFVSKSISASSEVYAREYVKFTAAFTVSTQVSSLLFFGTADSNTILVNLLRDVDGTYTWQINCRGTTYQDSQNTVALNVWHRLDFHAKISATVGIVDLAVDGVYLVNQTNINSGASNINELRIEAVQLGDADAGTIYFDDYVASTVGPIGSENSVGLTSDINNNSALQVSSSTTLKTTQNIADTTQEGTINSITVYMTAKASAGSLQATPLLITHSTLYNGSSQVISAVSFTNYTSTYLVNPFTSAAWTLAEVNALEIGAKASVLASSISFSEFFVTLDFGTPESTIIVYDSAENDGRVNVAANVNVYFRAKFSNDTVCSSGSLSVNGTSCSINSTGWAYRTVTQSSVLLRTYLVTAVNVGGYTNYTQTASNQQVIWDKLTVDFSASPSSTSNGNPSTLSWIITRQFDSTTVSSFSITVKRDGANYLVGTSASSKVETGTSIVHVYTASAVTDNAYGLTSFATDSQTITWTAAVTPPPPVTPPAAPARSSGSVAKGYFNIRVPVGMGIGFQDDDKHLCINVFSGYWNSTNGHLLMNIHSGELTFTAINACTLNFTHDFGNLRIEENGVSGKLDVVDSFNIKAGRNYIIRWSNPIVYFDINSAMLMIGILFMFAGPLFFVYKAKQGEYKDGVVYGLIIIFFIGMAFVMVGLWPSR